MDVHIWLYVRIKKVLKQQYFCVAIAIITESNLRILGVGVVHNNSLHSYHRPYQELQSLRNE